MHRGNHIIGASHLIAERLDVPAASAQLLGLVQSIVPRLTWLIAVVFALLSAPAFAQRKQSPAGLVPPQPVQLNVKVRREGKTEIPLRIHGLANEPLKFLVRTPPAHGRLSEPRQTGRETAVTIYEPPADLAITADKFFYAAQSAAGVSAPVEVTLTIIDQPAQLTIPDTLEFPSLRAGGTNSKLLEINNRGGSVAAGEVIVEAPWRIEGQTTYRLSAGDIAIFKVIFAPTAGGAFEGVARFTSDPAHSTTLRGTAETSVAASPAQVILHNEPSDPIRNGAFELTNQTDEPRTLQIKADSRLQVPPQVTLPARGRVNVPIQTTPGDVRALNVEIRVTGPDLDLRVPVKAAAPGAILRANQPALAFGQLPVGRTASVRFEFENIGGAAGEIAWTIGTPFRTAQNSALLLPGEKRAFDMEIETKTTGRYRAWLQCKSATQTFELPVEAEIVAGMRPPKTGGVAAGSAPPPSAESPTTPENIEPTKTYVVPDEWFRTRALPAGVRVAKLTPTSATLQWPVSLSAATRFRIDLRRLSYAADGSLQVNWLELSGLEVKREGQNYLTTIHELQPAQPWTIRVLPLKETGEPDQRLFAIDFRTPAPSSLLPKVSPLHGLLVALLGLIVWQAAAHWRRRQSPSGL